MESDWKFAYGHSHMHGLFECLRGSECRAETFRAYLRDALDMHDNISKLRGKIINDGVSR